MSRGKSKVYLRKTQKEVIQEEEELDRGTGVVPSHKRRQSCQKVGWGALTEQRNPILSENPFTYRFM